VVSCFGSILVEFVGVFPLGHSISPFSSRAPGFPFLPGPSSTQETDRQFLSPGRKRPLSSPSAISAIPLQGKGGESPLGGGEPRKGGRFKPKEKKLELSNGDFHRREPLRGGGGGVIKEGTLWGPNFGGSAVSGWVHCLGGGFWGV